MLRVALTGCGVTRCTLRVTRCEVNSRQSEIPNPNSETDSIPNPRSRNLAFNLLAVIIDCPYIYLLRVPGNFIGFRIGLVFTS